VADKKARHTFLLGVSGGVISQIVTVIVGLISVPIGLSYLGGLQFGVWVTINSIVTYLGLSQFGTGTAAASMIAKESNSGKQSKILRLAVKYLARFSFVLVMIVLLLSIMPKPWVEIFGSIPLDLQHEAVLSVMIISVLFFIRMPTIAFTSGFIGLQEVHWERLYAVVLPVLFGFLALLLTVYYKGGLIMLACLTGLAHLLSGILGTIHFLVKHNSLWSGAKQSIAASETIDAKNLLVSSSRFFFIGVAAIVVWHTDNLVISYFLGPDAVTSYSITFRLFTAGFSIFIVMTSALWPMFGHAFGQNDWAWIQNIYRDGLLWFAIIGGAVWIGGLLFAKPIIDLWTGSAGYAGALVVFALGGYGYILSMINLHANLLSGLNFTKAMLWLGAAEAILNLLLSIIFIHFWGIGGVALATFISALLTVFWLLPMDVRRQTQGKVSMSWPPILKHFISVVVPFIVLAIALPHLVTGLKAIAISLLLIISYLLLSWLFLPMNLRLQLYNLMPFRIR